MTSSVREQAASVASELEVDLTPENPASTAPTGGKKPASMVDAWDRFVEAGDSQVFATAWLSLLVERIGQVTAAVVLLEQGGDKSFAPLAVWPQASPEMERLGKAIEKTLDDKRGIIFEVSGGLQRLAYPLIDGEKVLAVVAMELRGNSQQASRAFREIHWAGAWIRQLVTGNDRAQALLIRDRLSAVMDNLAVLLRHGKLQQALFESTNSLRAQLQCSRVSLGLVKGHGVKLSAVSDAAEFDRHAPLSKSYEEAMVEALDVGSPVLAALEKTAEGDLAALSRAERLRAAADAGSVLAFPLRTGVDTVAVLLFERAEHAFPPNDMAWIDAFGALASPLLEARIKAEEGAWRRAQRTLGEWLRKLLGPGHLTWKVVSLCLLLAALVLAIPVQYRVSAKTVIEGEVHRVLSAPIDGFVAAAPARPGDVVTAGQVLARLDDKDLRIEESKWASEADQHSNRLREAMAKHDLASISQISAQLAQSRAQLNLITQKIGRSEVKAPFDGVVVSGDLSQELGASVEMGKRLFEIAPLDSYRVILQVDERDVRFVELGHAGVIVMTGLAGEPMDFKVNAITPVATAEDGKNFFRVEASLEGGLPRLRPGMEGVGKIETERRSLWWVLTHGLTDWLRLSLWQWMP